MSECDNTLLDNFEMFCCSLRSDRVAYICVLFLKTSLSNRTSYHCNSLVRLYAKCLEAS